MSETVVNLLNEIYHKHEVLSNPLRTLILTIVLAQNEVSWNDVVGNLESVMKRRFNPNSISFHLKRLIDGGFVEKSGTVYIPGPKAIEVQGELEKLTVELRKEIES
ncbi:MAG: hypothetical protein H3Z52_10570 [archaeon]|nr:hypothetical protein [archaeon]MCP8321364.1 hypothetical protein [archaeon]